MTFQSSTQAFNKAYEMLKEGVQCKLYRLDGVWTVEVRV
jgi:hypothetical protein